MKRLHFFLSFLACALIPGATPAANGSPLLTLRTAQHTNSTRLVLDLPQANPRYTVEEIPSGLRVHISGHAPAAAAQAATKEVSATRLTSTDAGTLWEIDTHAPLNGAFKVAVLAATSGSGSRLVIDLGPALRPTPTVKPSAATPCLKRGAGVPTLSAPSPVRLSGQLGLYVALLDPVTAEPTRAVALNPDLQFPLASAYKAPLLWAVMREVDAGRVSLNEKLTTDPQSRSLGKYPSGQNDVLTLARLMIERSDNTATDLLHRRIGLPRVQELADTLGLCRTRLLLPTKTWWTAQAGLSPDFPNKQLRQAAERYARAPREQQIALAERLDAAARTVTAPALEAALERYFNSRTYQPEIDRDTQNASTPFEFATLLARQYLKSGLKPESDSVMRETLHLGCCVKRVDFPITYWGGKGGSGWRILTMAGYAELPGGERVVYVFLNQRSGRTVDSLSDIPAAFGWINAAIRKLLPDVQAAK